MYHGNTNRAPIQKHFTLWPTPLESFHFLQEDNYGANLNITKVAIKLSLIILYIGAKAFTADIHVVV